MRVSDMPNYDSRYPYVVRPAFRADPNPSIDSLNVAVWCVGMPLSALIALLAIVRVGLLVHDLLFSKVH